MRSFLAVSLSAALLGSVVAHGDHALEVDPNADWMTRHMAEEHHIADFDAGSFFTLHDFNGNGQWEVDEVLRTYGLYDESNSHISPQQRDSIASQILGMVDLNNDGIIQRDEWTTFIGSGKTLPDVGTGPGHHGDDEYEYEIHHWEKYHNEDSPIEELNHPEDIEHFKKHEEMEEAQERLEQMEKEQVIIKNIPNKFRRDL